MPEGYENNWVQSKVGKGFFVYLRFYGPTEACFDKSWKMPDVKRVKQGLGDNPAEREEPMKSRIAGVPKVCRTIIPAMLFVGFLLIAGSCGGEPPQSAGDAVTAVPPSTVTQTSNVNLSADLLEAAFSGDANAALEALKQGADPNHVNENGRTALMLAAFNGHSQCVSYLLDAGAEVDLRDVQGRTALMFAASGPFEETVLILLENGADPLAVDNDEQFTALMFAASEGHAGVVRALLEHGADPAVADVDGDTALSFATQHGHAEVVGLLEAEGAGR